MVESVADREERGKKGKEPYRKPEIVFTQKVESRAAVCAFTL